MNQRQIRACPICDSDRMSEIYLPSKTETSPEKLYGAASGIRGTQRLVKCTECDLIYENPVYDAEVIINGYKNSQESGHDSQYPMRVQSFYKALKKNSRHLPPAGSRVLDIGTAGGSFLEAASQYGYDAFGMEPSIDLVERGRKRGLKIEQGTIDNHNFETASFDLVCLWDVIEHLPEPREALDKIRKLIKPDGILLINFPDIGTWQAKLAGKYFWWIISVHLHHFTRSTITELCRRSGLEIINFRPYWQILEFGYLERMAIHYNIPLTGLITSMTPGFIQRIPIPYYASQTTALARIAP